MKLPKYTNQAARRPTRLALVVLATVLVSSPHWLSKSRALSIDDHRQQQQVGTASGQINLIARTGAAPKGTPPPASVLQVASSAATQQVQLHDTRRPIWALAHMVNSIKELDYRLRLGANAVEADVTFARDGVPKYTYHGPPCDCWRHCHQQENFNEYLQFVREQSIDISDGLGQNLTLLFLDLKLDPLDQLAKGRAGMELAKSLTDNLFLNIQRNLPRHFHVILSVNHVGDIELVRNFIYALERANSSYLLDKNIGFDVGMNDDLGQIESMWHKFSSSSGGMHLNLWQGDGYTNCFSPFYNLERLSRAIGKRDSALQGSFPAKVYHWTIDLRDRMRESLLMGVDAIMTNHPERVLAILQEPDMAHDFRLATRDDNLFQRLPRRVGVLRAGETARYQRSAAQTSSGASGGGGLLGSLLDVLNSWLNYVKEIPFLSLPSTILSRSASTIKLQKRQTVSALKSAPTIEQQKPCVQQSVEATTRTVTKMFLAPHVEYTLIENATAATTKTTTTTTPTTAAPTTATLDQQRNSADSINSTSAPAEVAQPSNTTQQVQQQQLEDTRPEYEGPKWYTSLISNMLVSAIKVVLPP